MDNDLLIRNGFIDLPATAKVALDDAKVSPEAATLLSNLATYGYTLDREAAATLLSLDNAALATWWEEIEPVLKEVTGANRNMGEFMVYKNFPREVLDMDQVDYIARQIAIYHGMPYDLLTEDEEARPLMGDMKSLKVLRAADGETESKIFADLTAMRNRWSDNQIIWAEKLVQDRNVIAVGDFAFRENGVRLAAKHFDDKEITLSTGTDVLRLSAALSDADISLREKVKFRRFKRSERRKLLSALEQQPNLEADMAERPGVWKRLMEHLRPGDYTMPRVQAAYDDLYNGRTKSFAARVDPQQPSEDMLDAAASRPGEFLRRFHHLYEIFGDAAVDRFSSVMDKLTTRQLAGFRAYLSTINQRQFMIYAPKSNWGRAQVKPNEKKKIDAEHIKTLDDTISVIMRDRLSEAFPEGLLLDPVVEAVKLQTNDQKLAEYGRGTEFDIGEEITFVRSASYWEQSGGTNWFDNGWNFFDSDWKSVGVCSWTDPQFGKAAIFSGDPVNSRDLRGRGCQMVDLYLDKLAEKGVRYAVWNVLCYSNIKFADATEVLATLQMGENAEKGKVYEPARATMICPLKGNALASYVAYIDIERRKLIYMDVGFPARVSDAGSNSQKLMELMPAYQEYLASLPSMLDVLRDAPEGTLPVLYGDRDEVIETEKAFVFRPENADNSFTALSVTDMVVG